MNVAPDRRDEAWLLNPAKRESFTFFFSFFSVMTSCYISKDLEKCADFETVTENSVRVKL